MNSLQSTAPASEDGGVESRPLLGQLAMSEETLVDVNCAGLSKDLLESERFGYEKGAFTGAAGSKQGLVEAAHKGILFLDEYPSG